MDPGYKKEHLDKIIKMANDIGVDIEVFKTDIFAIIVTHIKKHLTYEKNPIHHALRTHHDSMR